MLSATSEVLSLPGITSAIPWGSVLPQVSLSVTHYHPLRGFHSRSHLPSLLQGLCHPCCHPLSGFCHPYCHTVPPPHLSAAFNPSECHRILE